MGQTTPDQEDVTGREVEWSNDGGKTWVRINALSTSIVGSVRLPWDDGCGNQYRAVSDG